MRGKVSYIMGMVFVLWVAFALRVWDLHNLPPGIYYDMGRILQRIWRVNEGYGVLLYFQDIAEPFDFLLRAIYHRLTGGINLYMSQLFTIWLNVLAVAATGLCARVLYHKHPHRNLISLFASFTLATMPTAIMLGQHLFRANWLPVTIPLTVTAIILAWRTQKMLPALLSGIFMGISTSFYTGGLLFPPAMALAILLQLLLTGIKWIRVKQLFVMSIGFGLAMLPWLYYFIRVPDWFLRVGDLSEGQSPLSNSDLLLEHIQITLATIFVPTSLHDLRYNTFTTAFLNPIFVVLFVIGLAITLWRWRRSWYLTPLLIACIMIFPNVLSSEPYQPVRMVGTFMGLSLLVGLGASELYRTPMKRLTGLGLFAILLVTPFYTGYQVWYHFNQQAQITNPHMPLSIALKYRLGFEDLLVDMAETEMPTYVPLEYLDSDLAVNVLRIQRDYTVSGYDGRELPNGRVVMPRNDQTYGFFILDYIPAQYGLVLPDTREIIILPALSSDDATVLHEMILNEGNELTNDKGWVLGQQQILDDTHVFSELSNVVGDVIATYDDTLELVGIDAPSELIPNSVQPITLYWRLKEQTGRDYYSRLQVWSYDDISHGFEHTSPLVGEPDFPLNIHFNIYPTVMWEAGEIVADTRYLPISETLPAGGYRFALAVYRYPGFVPVDTSAPVRDIWGMVGRTSFDLTQFTTPAETPSTQTIVGDAYHLREYTLSMPSTDLQAGDTLSASITWYVESLTDQDYITYLHILDATGTLVAQQDTQPFAGQFPTWAFPTGHDVTLDYALTIPEDALAPFTVRTGMYTYPEIQALSVTQDGELTPENFIILE